MKSKGESEEPTNQEVTTSHGFWQPRPRDQVRSASLLTSTMPYILETGPRKIFFYSGCKSIRRRAVCVISHFKIRQKIGEHHCSNLALR